MADPANPAPNDSVSALPDQSVQEGELRTRKTLRLSAGFERPLPARSPLFRR